MVQLLNSIYLGAATPSDYGKAAGVVELLPFEYYLGAAVPSHGKPTINVLLSGVSPLTLLNAVSLNYIKAFGKCEQDSETYIDSVTLDGKCEQDGTPTPTSPVDIVCNNGTIKARHQSGLPLGYTLLDYIQSTGTQYIDTGYKPTSTSILDLTITNFQTMQLTGKIIFGCGEGVWANSTGWVNAIAGSSGFSAWNCLSSGSNITYAALGITTGRVYTLRYGSNAIFVNDVKKMDFAGSSAIPQSYDRSFWLFRANTTDNNYNDGSWIFGRTTLYDNGTLVRDLVPATNSSNEVGMYDLVSGQFFTNQGTGDFVAGNTVSDTIEIYYDGTVETATDNVGNVATAQPLLSVGDYKDTQEVLTGAVTRNVGIYIMTGDESFGSSSAYGQSLYIQSWSQQNNAVKGGLLFCSHFLGTLQPGGTGAENTCFTNTTGHLYFRTSETATDFKQFLKDQYNAGTPVIIVYPLATATTETVSGQVLNKEPVTVTGSLTGLVANVVSSTHTVPKPTQPLDIVANNGVLKVSQNLLNPAQYESVTSTQSRWYYSNGYTLKAGTAYTLSCDGGVYVYIMKKSDSTALAQNSNSVTYTPTEDVEAWFRIYKSSGLPEKFNAQLELGSTATTYRPYGSVYYDGTVETVTSYAETNITDKLTTGYYITDLGTVTENAGSAYSDLLPVTVGVTYGFTLDSNSAKYIRVHGYDSNGDWTVLIARSPTVNDLDITFTVPTGVAYVRFSGPNKTVVFDAYTGGSATCQPLLSVGTYKDVQNITNGAITRNVGIKVFDGVSTGCKVTAVNLNSGRYYAVCGGQDFTATSDDVISSHFIPEPFSAGHTGIVYTVATNLVFVNTDQTLTTVELWNIWLQDQLTNGTPVIVVCPLATPTTETVTGQTLTITQGTNIVTAEGSVSDLELEVSYKAYAEVTVEEIEAVNTDENVEVIIS